MSVKPIVGNVKLCDFSGVKGYATYETAVKKGQDKLKIFDNQDFWFHWLVVALPSGRFAPCVIINNNVPGGPGMFIGIDNLCVVN